MEYKTLCFYREIRKLRPWRVEKCDKKKQKMKKRGSKRKTKARREQMCPLTPYLWLKAMI